MIFEILYDAWRNSELLLINGGFCHWHLRKDGQLTIREIFSTRRGAGSEMLKILKSKNPNSIFAKCPSDLLANDWYEKNGFVYEGYEITKMNRRINLWRLLL
jgi:DNA primase large subunit